MHNDEFLREAYFNSVRSDDVESVQRGLDKHPTLVHARWPGRGRPDGKMRSLGPEPYNRHSWIDAPVNPSNPLDPRYTSAPLIYTQNDAMVRLLVEYGADVNAKGTSGDIELLDWFYTPLWRAAHDGRTESVKLLVENGADVNYRNPDDTNQALMTAIENGQTEVAGYLVLIGATSDIFTASMLGCDSRVYDLISNGKSSVNLLDSHGRSPLDAALLMDSFRVPWPKRESHYRTAEVLIRCGAKVNPAHAAALGMSDWIREKLKIDPKLAEWQRPFVPLLTGAATSETPLEAARRRHGREEIVEMLDGKGP